MEAYFFDGIYYVIWHFKTFEWENLKTTLY